MSLGQIGAGIQGGVRGFSQGLELQRQLEGIQRQEQLRGGLASVFETAKAEGRQPTSEEILGVQSQFAPTQAATRILQQQTEQRKAKAKSLEDRINTLNKPIQDLLSKGKLQEAGEIATQFLNDPDNIDIRDRILSIDASKLQIPVGDEVAKLEILTDKETGGVRSIAFSKIGKPIFIDGQKIVAGQEIDILSDVQRNTLTPSQIREREQVKEDFRIKGELRKTVRGGDFTAVVDASADIGNAMQLFNSNPNLILNPGRRLGRGESGQFQAAMENVFSNILRIRSGLTVTEAEVNRMKTAFQPGVFNDEKNARSKLRRLDSLLTLMRQSQLDPGGFELYEKRFRVIRKEILEEGAPSQRRTERPEPTQPPTGQPQVPAEFTNIEDVNKAIRNRTLNAGDKIIINGQERTIGE